MINRSRLPTIKRWWLVPSLFFFAWTCFVIRSYQVFGPDSVYVQAFNSDSALPVLMANDEVIDVFRTYIYGQDQIGAWPFLLGQLVHKITGYVWTPRSIYLVQVVWLCFSVILISALCRGYGYLVGLIAAGLFTLHPVVRHYFFVLNQRNAWHVTTLFLAWWSLRQISNHLTERGRRSALVILLLWLSSFLAVWQSSLSGPFLLALAVIELSRWRILDDNVVHRGVGFRTLCKLFLPILLAILVEAMLKANYHRHALKHFGSDFRTPTDFDWANLGTNLTRQWQVFTTQSWWQVALFGVSVSLAVLIYLVVKAFWRRIRRGSVSLATADLMVMVAGCGVIAWGSFIVTVLFTWVRLNSYGPRYLAQTNLFGLLAGLCTIVLIGRLIVGKRFENKSIIALSVGVVALLLLLTFPHPQRSPEFENLKTVAGELIEKRADVVLLGGYWDTYVFASLVAPGKIVPVPADDQFVRTPWTPKLMQAANSVVIVHHVFAPRSEVETPVPYSSFGDGENPPTEINQYGVTLRLAIPRWYQRYGYTFSIYNNESRQISR